MNESIDILLSQRQRVAMRQKLITRGGRYHPVPGGVAGGRIAGKMDMNRSRICAYA